MLAIIPKQHIKQTIKHPIILFLPIFAFALPILCQLNISEKMVKGYITEVKIDWPQTVSDKLN